MVGIGLWIEGEATIGQRLVTGGVAMEVFCAWWVLVASRKLQNILEEQFETLRLETAEANQRAEEARRASAEADEKTEKLRAENLALQNILKPRQMGLTAKNAGQLTVFSGTPVLIQSVPDFEAMKLAFNMQWVLQQLGWKLPQSVETMQTGIGSMNINEGLRIYSKGWSNARGLPRVEPGSAEAKALKAAQALSRYLFAEGISNSVQPTADVKGGNSSPPLKFLLPPDTLFVLIGMKPVRWEIEKLKLDPASRDIVEKWNRGDSR